MKRYLVVYDVDSGDCEFVWAKSATGAAELSKYVGEVDVHEIAETTVVTIQVERVGKAAGGPPPLPKLTQPDRPSNVGQLRPTVELPDLTLDDDLPF